GATVPGAHTRNTVKGVTLVATGKSAAGTLSSLAIALGEESMKGMLGFKGKVLLLLLAAGLAAGGGGLAGYQTPGEKSPAVSQGKARGPSTGTEERSQQQADGAGDLD